MGQTDEKSMIARASGLKTPEYICYALGDAGGCLVFGLVTSILQTYYTDVLILSPKSIIRRPRLRSKLHDNRQNAVPVLGGDVASKALR